MTFISIVRSRKWLKMNKQNINHKLALICSISILFIYSVIFPVKAKQISFTKHQEAQQVAFSYRWNDYKNTEQSMSFKLNNESIFERFRHLKSYQADFAQKSILRNIKQQLRKERLAGVNIHYTHQHGETKIEVRGQNETKIAAAYAKIKKVEQEQTALYYQQNYYQVFTNFDQATGIKVDHRSIANDSVLDLKPLKPLILEKVSIKNIRKVTNYVLGFIQSIPYATLEDRMTSSGAGFNPPLKLLWENQGDCDSKMTLAAAILRSLMPRIEMALIYIDQHAFIGIAIPAEAGETTIHHEGIDYLLADPTGPAVLPLGKLGPESELAITQGQYVAESFHATHLTEE